MPTPMLRLRLNDGEFYDDDAEQFVYTTGREVRLEHSLYSVSKWEAETEKPFLTKKAKTVSEEILYIQCMDVDEILSLVEAGWLYSQYQSQIAEYLKRSMTATTFRKDNSRSSSATITAEIIYYWLVLYNIPFETQYWPLNKLLTLVRVASIKSQKPKKMSRQEQLSQQNAINSARLAAMASKR